MADAARKVFGAAAADSGPAKLTPGTVGGQAGRRLLHWYKQTLFQAIGDDERMSDELRVAQQATGLNPWETPSLEPILNRNALIFQHLVDDLGIDLNLALEYAMDLLRKDTVTAFIGENAAQATPSVVE